MIEYEYSIKATSITPFIDYCKSNGYKLVSVSNENRLVYENANNKNIISRLTISQKNGKDTVLFDFKNKSTGNNTFKIAEESLPLELTKDQINIAKSILNVLEFKEVADNLRTRYVYEKDSIKFEIDEYTRPQMNIIGIEGQKDIVDEVYNTLVKCEDISKYIIKVEQ